MASLSLMSSLLTALVQTCQRILSSGVNEDPTKEKVFKLRVLCVEYSCGCMNGSPCYCYLFRTEQGPKSIY